MAARANLVLKDRAATPVNHTFAPAGDKGDVHRFVEKSSVSIGDRVYTVSLREGDTRWTITARLIVPSVQTQVINGVSNPVIVHTSYVDFKVTFSKLSTEQERKDVIGMFADSLGASQTQVNDLMTGLLDIY